MEQVFDLVYKFEILVGKSNFVFCVSICFGTHYFVSFLVFVIILNRKRELAALLLLFYGCLVTVNVQWLFLTMHWVGLQCVIVVFPDHTHLHFLVFNSK